MTIRNGGLTPDGGVRGTAQADFAVDEKAPPAAVVLTQAVRSM